MFAALAVGLLALIAVEGKILYQYKTLAYKGGISDEVDLHFKAVFYIPHGQCTGHIDKNVYCDGKPPLAMEVSVLDNEPHPSVEIDLIRHGTVRRAGRCEGLARVTLRLLCPDWSGQLRNAPVCVGPGCDQSKQGCSGPDCEESKKACSGPGCDESRQGCPGPGCNRSRPSCSGSGCSRMLRGCSGPGCRQLSLGCSGGGCGQASLGCSGPGCSQAGLVDWICTTEGCRPLRRGCSGKGCLQSIPGCTGPGCSLPRL